MNDDEVALTGGNVNQSVVRVGDTVRRAQTPASPAIHRLLRHLEAKGFTGAPRFRGIDAQGRETLSFIAGAVNDTAHLWTEDPPLLAGARLLRAYHDATADFVSGPDDVWAYRHPDPTRHEVISHNDFAPYNLVFADGMPIAAIDFDLVGPGPRLRDLAYAAYWMVPLSFGAGDMRAPAMRDLAEGSRRLKAFCQAYGVATDTALLDWVAAVLHDMGAPTFATAMVGPAVAARLQLDGHFDHWHRERDAFHAKRQNLVANLEL
ncbi:phosphotransferase [Devosia sp. J2-20]|uniref:phosphotransferase n=1 Tax=Devosia sp. J2-20 TaxID=3026161 RepID=UPI00249BBDB0|nr:phosphotransferase [Devosia sp. J2-20]WDQ98475.1 phosphotransferase [Devosia sp. J2-20]